MARSFRTKFKQAVCAIAHLRKQKAATVAYVWIIIAELMPVVTQRERLWQVVIKRGKSPEMLQPSVIA